MALEKWSDSVAMARPASDAQLGEDIGGVEEMLAHAPVDVVVDFSEMTFLGSTDLARLISLRKKLNAAGTKLVLCGVPSQLHGTFQVTGLTKIFNFADNISTALASLQMTSNE